ncbi:hypothetical protein [Polaromonas sp. YR568]|uniref:hypothetical protein n=1 Tax=Polaromonas sp. YR568 TaxID=1855301 RepID=UPI00313819CB
MGIISFSSSPLLSILLAPVQALAGWFVPAHHAAPRASGSVQMQPSSDHLPRRRAHSVNTQGGNTPRACGGMARASRQSRLKIVREFDASVGASCAGRMVITGRMADVCAELDRMARLESAGG